MLTKIFKHLGLTSHEDEYGDHSTINWVNGRTFTLKRRFTKVDGDLHLSREVLTSRSSTSASSTIPLDNSTGSVSSVVTRSDLNKIDKKIDRKMNKIIFYLSKIPGMPHIPSDDEDD